MLFPEHIWSSKKGRIQIDARETILKSWTFFYCSWLRRLWRDWSCNFRGAKVICLSHQLEMLVGNEVLDSFFASQPSAKSWAVVDGISRFVIRLSVLNHIFSWNCFLVGHLPSWHLDVNTSQLKTSQTSWPRYQCWYLVCCKPQDEELYPSPRDEDFDPTLSCNIQRSFFWGTPVRFSKVQTLDASALSDVWLRGLGASGRA